MDGDYSSTEHKQIVHINVSRDLERKLTKRDELIKFVVNHLNPALDHAIPLNSGEFQIRGVDIVGLRAALRHAESLLEEANNPNQ